MDTFDIKIRKYDLESAVGIDLDDHDCETIVDYLADNMSSYAAEELIRDAAARAGLIADDEDDREDNPSKPGERALTAACNRADKAAKEAWRRASDVLYGYVHGVYGRDALERKIEEFRGAVKAQHAANDAWNEFIEHQRTGNPSLSGLSLGSVALGAALGAGAYHLIKRKTQ